MVRAKSDTFCGRCHARCPSYIYAHTYTSSAHHESVIGIRQAQIVHAVEVSSAMVHMLMAAGKFLWSGWKRGVTDKGVSLLATFFHALDNLL